MKYVCGIDGGGTKTVCVIANDKGDVVGMSFAGCSNHQICGLETAVQTVTDLILNALTMSELTIDSLSSIVMGLAGADLEQEIEMLTEQFSKALPNLSITIVTDLWIAFSAEVHEGWGAISVCGTGHNTGVLTPEGEVIGVRALRYNLGNYGGGRHMTDLAFHFAFRSSESTGDFTELERRLPGLCKARDMDHLAHLVYESHYTYQYDFPVPKVVFELALEGDAVSKKIITDMGSELGRMTGGLVQKTGLQRKEVPIVLAGTVYSGGDLIVRAFQDSISRYVEKFKIHLLSEQPVSGAVFMALKETGVVLTNEIIQKVKEGM